MFILVEVLIEASAYGGNFLQSWRKAASCWRKTFFLGSAHLELNAIQPAEQQRIGQGADQRHAANEPEGPGKRACRVEDHPNHDRGDDAANVGGEAGNPAGQT